MKIKCILEFTGNPEITLDRIKSMLIALSRYIPVNLNIIMLKELNESKTRKLEINYNKALDLLNDLLSVENSEQAANMITDFFDDIN